MAIRGGLTWKGGPGHAQDTIGLEMYRAGQTGLLRLSWDNGDRTVLVNPELGRVTLGWNEMSSALIQRGFVRYSFYL
jgi:hypothetical protein